MLTNGGRPLGELTAEEIDQLINQKSAEIDNMKHVHRKDSGDLNSTNRLRENIRGRHYLNSELESSKPRFVPNLTSIPKVSYNKMPNRPQTGRADYSKKDLQDVNRYDVTAQNDRPADRRETAGRSASASLVDRYDRNVSAEPRDPPKDIVRENSTQRVKQEAQSIVIALKEAVQKNREIQSELNKYRDSASRLEEELILAKEVFLFDCIREKIP